MSLGDQKMFLPELTKMQALSYLQYLSLEQFMGWKLVVKHARVILTRINHHQVRALGSEQWVLRLLPICMQADYPLGESPQ